GAGFGGSPASAHLAGLVVSPSVRREPWWLRNCAGVPVRGEDRGDAAVGGHGVRPCLAAGHSTVTETAIGVVAPAVHHGAEVRNRDDTSMGAARGDPGNAVDSRNTLGARCPHALKPVDRPHPEVVALVVAHDDRSA